MQLNLVIVGKQGWMVSDLCDESRRHPELGMQLFWFDEISDAELGHLYATCTCLIAASEDEGSGLPLIEAAQHGLPIIARRSGGSHIPMARTPPCRPSSKVTAHSGADVGRQRSQLDVSRTRYARGRRARSRVHRFREGQATKLIIQIHCHIVTT